MERVPAMSEIEECRQAICSVVCGLLVRCHRTHGLCVWPWTRRPGPTYFSFYCAAARGDDGWPLFLPDFNGTYCLTIFQTHVGIPSWSGPEVYDRQSVESICNLEQLRRWYDQRLSIDAFLRDQADAISTWRTGYLNDEAERYLLTFRVAAATAAQLRQPLLAYDGDIDGSISDEEVELQRRLQTERPHERILRVGKIGFSVDGRACLPSGDLLYLRRLQREEPRVEAIAANIIRATQVDRT